MKKRTRKTNGTTPKRVFSCGMEEDRFRSYQDLPRLTPWGSLKRLKREEWEEYEAEIMPGWIEDHPGTRPRGWWLFDTVGGRQKIIDGVGVDQPIKNKPWLEVLGILKDGPADELFESQASYLARKFLIGDDEAQALELEAMEPETRAHILASVEGLAG
jgi:hypothetical protein